MSTLTKSFVPFYAGDPGVPPTPPSPAYCIDVTTMQQTYGVQIIQLPPTPESPGGSITWFAYSTGIKPVTYQQCYPATDGDPGVPPVPASPADYNIGWNASARSVASFSGSGDYTFSVPTDSVGVVTGLNDFNNGSSYQEIDYAFYLASGQYQILEKGVQVGPSGGFTITDVFKISRVGTTVTYLINNTPAYTSTKPSSGTVFVDSSLYFGNDQIINATMTDTTVANDGTLAGFLTGMTGNFNELDGYMSGTLSQMYGYFADVNFIDQYAHELLGTFDGLTGLFGADGGIYALQGELSGLQGEFITSDIGCVVDGTLDGMTGYMECGLLAPNFTTMTLLLQQLGYFAVALAGMAAQVSGVLSGLHSFISTLPDGGYLQPGIPPDAVDASGDWEGRSGDQLRMLTGFFIDKASTDAGSSVTQTMIELPHPLRTSGSIPLTGVVSSGAGSVLPFPLTTYVEMGAQADVLLPMMSVDADGTIPNILRIDLILPMMIGEGTGTVGNMLGVSDDYPLSLPRLTVDSSISGQSGGAAVLPALEAAGKIIASTTLDGDIRLPMLVVDANLITPMWVDPQNPLGRTLQGHVLLPALQGMKNAYGAVLLPRLRVSARVRAVAGVVVEGRITYAMNLKNSAVTEFSNYPFQAMGRAFNQYWGVGLDGNLYRMGGDLDDAAPIDWEWLSGTNDFGVWGQKGALGVYIRAVFENGAIVKFVTDDAVREYDHLAAGDYKNQKVHRVLLGRGVRTDSMAFGMYNPAGGYLELDKVTPEYRIIPRNL